MNGGYKVMGFRVVALLAIFSLCGVGSSSRDTHRDAIILDMMEAAGIPGLQTVVIKNGRTVWTKSYGYAVLDRPGPRRTMTNDSILWSASVEKILVTTAVLQQVEKGRLKLDDDINASLPFRVRNPAWPNVPITWRMLLTHTSSLNTEDDAQASSTLFYGRDPDVTLEEVMTEHFGVLGAGRRPQQFRPRKPGTERIYSNDGFSLAGFALQRVLHQPLDRYIGHAILFPLGMRSTSYSLHRLPVSRLAVGYASIRQTGGGYRYPPAMSYWAHRSPGGRAIDHQMSCSDYPSGCLHTTSADFAQLMLMLVNKGTHNGVRILAPESVKLMVTATGFRNLDGWNQGLGFNGPEDLRGRQLWGHDGVDRGAATAFYFNPKTADGFITFANANNPDFSLGYAVDDIGMHLLLWFE